MQPPRTCGSHRLTALRRVLWPSVRVYHQYELYVHKVHTRDTCRDRSIQPLIRALPAWIFASSSHSLLAFSPLSLALSLVAASGQRLVLNLREHYSSQVNSATQINPEFSRQIDALDLDTGEESGRSPVFDPQRIPMIPLMDLLVSQDEITLQVSRTDTESRDDSKCIAADCTFSEGGRPRKGIMGSTRNAPGQP
jgi:hypothetical protein